MVVDLKSFENTKNFVEYDGVSGIYAFVHNNEVIYVGQSINVRRRLSSHHCTGTKLREGKNPCFYKFLQNHMSEVFFLVVPADREQLNQLEEKYINKYKPKFNWSGVHTKYKPLQRYLW